MKKPNLPETANQNINDSDLLKSKGFECVGEMNTYTDEDKFSIRVAAVTSYDKEDIVSEYKNVHYEYFSYLSDTLFIPELRKSYSVIVGDKVVEITYKDCFCKPGIMDKLEDIFELKE